MFNRNDIVTDGTYFGRVLEVYSAAVIIVAWFTEARNLFNSNGDKNCRSEFAHELKSVHTRYPIEPPATLIALAMEWHEGQTSAMYSLLSTKLIHNDDHLHNLSCEFDRALRLAKTKQLRYACGYLDGLSL